MNINCIIKNTKIFNQLEVLVSEIADMLILNDTVPTPSNIYNQIRNLGVEIDLSTIGGIYAKNLSGTDKTFLSVKEVQKEVGSDFNNTIKKIIQLDKGTKEIGKQSPAEAVAKAIANIFVNRNAAPQQKTLMRQMQDIVLKGVKRSLPKDNPLNNSISPLDVIREALKNMATLGVTDIKGQLNSLEDVFNDVQAELNKYLDELGKNTKVSPDTLAKYQDMIDNIKNSTYQLLLSKTEAKDAITEAIKKYKNGAFTKTDSKGVVKLDYDALSGHIKSEQDLRNNVEAALKSQGFSDSEISIITNSLAQEFKDAYANILQKAINKLNAKRDAKDRNVISKSDTERLAQLHALNAFGSAHEKMIYELLGLNEDSSVDLNTIEEIAEELNRMKDAGFTEGNDRERQLNDKIDNIIAEARFRDAGWLYKTAKVMSDVYSMALLAILNNVKNRVENFSSGKIELLNNTVRNGIGLPSEINKLASATKKDIINNGGLSYGEMNMLFQGNNQATEKVRQKLNGWLAADNEKGGRIVNWWYNQIMGTAALNGIDSYNKVKNTWSRFISNMEQVLLDKGLVSNRQDAQKALHEQLFGDAWKKAEQKAKQLTDTIEKDGSVLKKATPEMIQRLAADIVKMELINNKLVTEEELNATWDASYKASGRAMGHVSNNYFSSALQSLNTKGQQEIQKQLDKGNYNFAAALVFGDMLVNKVVLKFAGGGTNWVVLNVEKSGLGLLLGGIKKLIIGKQKSLSEMTPKEIEEELYRHQVQNDKMVRGAVGLTINAALFLTAFALVGGDDDEDKKRRKNILNWVEKNKWANKYINVLPLYISGYLAVMKQKDTKKGMAGTFDKYSYSPLKNFIDNFTNRSDTYSFDTQVTKAFAGISNNAKGDDTREKNQEKGWNTLGIMLGSYFNFDPLPYRPVKDMKDVYDGVMGNPTKSERDKKAVSEKKSDGEVNWIESMIDGYRKFGVTDW